MHRQSILTFLFLQLCLFFNEFTVYCNSLPQQNPSRVPSYSSSSSSTFGGEQHESFEEKVDAWRHQQLEKQLHQTPQQAASPTDEQGRMKLLATVSNASICIFFFVLIWRTVHHFEIADAAFKGVKRLFLVIPIVFLFVGNMAGCVASLSTPSHASKKRLKAILNLNKLVEVVLFLYNIVRLTVFPSRYVAREIYVGRTLTNFIFLVQCQLFTKVAWDAAKMKSSTAEQEETYPYSSESYESYPYEYQQQQNSQRQSSPDGYSYESGYEREEWK